MPILPPTAERIAAGHTQRRLFAWTLLCAVALGALMAAPFCLGRIYTSDDLWAFHIPTRQFYAQCLAEGESPAWLPGLYGGFYLAGEGQAGLYHPWHYVLYRWLPLSAALGVEFLSSYPFMLVGAYLFLRRRTQRRDAAMFGALAFTFGGFNLLHFVHPNGVAVVAHIPWLLWASDVSFAPLRSWQRPLAHFAIAILTASQLLVGYPQCVWFSLLVEMGYAAYLLWSPQWRALKIWLVAALAMFKVLGLGIAAVQVLPTLEALQESARQVADSRVSHQGALHPLNVMQLVAPYLFHERVIGGNTHEFGLYCGAVPLVLCVWLALRWKQLSRRRRTFAGAALAMAFVALLLAFGRYGGLYELQTQLPLVGKFRFPARYVVLVQLGLTTAAAVALADLVQFNRKSFRIRWYHFNALWRLTFVAVVIAVFVPAIWGPQSVNTGPLAFVGPALIGGAAILVALAARGARWAATALILLTAADLGAYGLTYAIWPNTFDPDLALATVPASPARPGQRVAVELPDPKHSGLRTGNQSLLRGARQIDGYAGLEPQRALDYRQVRSLQLAGVHYVARRDTTHSIPGLIPHDEHWYRVPNPLPRARLVSQAVRSKEIAKDLPSIRLSTTALVDRPLELGAGDSTGQVQLVSDRPGRIVVQVAAADRQLLTVSERYHAGWQTTIDDRPCPTIRVHGEFLGCVVGPGSQRVEFRFAPDGLRWGKRLSAAGLVLVMCLTAGRLFVGAVAGFYSRRGATARTPGGFRTGAAGTPRRT